MTPFGTEEYQTRVANVQSRLADRGLDTLVVTDPANINYLTGYDAWSFYVPQAVIIEQEAAQPRWFGRAMDAEAARLTTWMADERIHRYSDEYVQAADDRHPMDVLVDLFNEANIESQTVGIETDSHHFTVQSYQRLTSGLEHATIRDGSQIVNRERLIKTEQEIKYIRQATELAEAAMEAAYSVINTGVRECDVIAEVMHAQISGADNYAGEYTSIIPLMPTGEGTTTPHLTWSDESLSEGPVILELAGCRYRYHSPLARSAFIGDPPQQVMKLSEAIQDGLDAAIDAIEPGVTCSAVEKAWRKTISEYGFKKESRIGYAMGLGYPPDWGERTASFRPEDTTELQPNMTFHLIPGIWLDEFGIEISESIRVTESGAEVFSDFSRELFVP